MDKKKKNRVVLLVAAMFLCGVLYLMLGPGGGRADSSEADLFTAGGSGEDREEDVQKEAKTAEPTVTGDSRQETEGTAQTIVYVYICGAVKKPGVYTFDHDPRVVEVVDQAGGFTKKADRTSVNLAGQLTDGAQLVVSEKGQGGGASSTTGTTGTDGGGNDRVNINTAGLEELTTIPGIGEAKATAILTYREENGRFEKPEDLMNISGIKQGTFDRIKDYISV